MFATFPEYHVGLAQQVAAQRCAGQGFVLVVHNPRELDAPGDSTPCTREWNGSTCSKLARFERCVIRGIRSSMP